MMATLHERLESLLRFFEENLVAGHTLSKLTIKQGRSKRFFFLDDKGRVCSSFPFELPDSDVTEAELEEAVALAAERVGVTVSASHGG